MKERLILSAIITVLSMALLLITVCYIRRTCRARRLSGKIKGLYISADMTSAFAGYDPVMFKDMTKSMVGKTCLDYDGIPWGTIKGVVNDHDKVIAEIEIMPERAGEISHLMASMGGPVSVQHVSAPAS
jgi:hypothetical protein